MFLRLITPAPVRSRSGNRITAERWAGLLKDLGHRVEIAREYDGGPCDVLIALHALKSFEAIRRFHLARPGAPLVVALGGTDLYRDIHRSRNARLSLEWAMRLVVLQPMGIDGLPPPYRAKTRVILQSAVRPLGPVTPPRGTFRVCVLSHLRAVKDPFRAAMASRLLPASSRIQVLHLGRALTERMAAWAMQETARNPRYEWRGELPHWRALRILAGSQLMVLASRMEGGANVTTEALAAGVPILASQIPGSVGILGGGYPGFFPAGDTRKLLCLLERSESDQSFYARLRVWCGKIAPLIRPPRERKAWKELLREITPFRPPGDPVRRPSRRAATQARKGLGAAR